MNSWNNARSNAELSNFSVSIVKWQKSLKLVWNCSTVQPSLPAGSVNKCLNSTLRENHHIVFTSAVFGSRSEAPDLLSGTVMQCLASLHTEIRQYTYGTTPSHFHFRLQTYLSLNPSHYRLLTTLTRLISQIPSLFSRFFICLSFCGVYM